MKKKLEEFLELEKVTVSEPWVAMKFGDEIGVYQGPVKKQRGSMSYKSNICTLEDPDISDLPTVRLRQLAEFIAQSRTIAPLAVNKLFEAVKLLNNLLHRFEVVAIEGEQDPNWFGEFNETKKFLEDFNNEN
jgi:hypothetical protein